MGSDYDAGLFIKLTIFVIFASQGLQSNPQIIGLKLQGRPRKGPQFTETAM